jgi:hypothetical protein
MTFDIRIQFENLPLSSVSFSLLIMLFSFTFKFSSKFEKINFKLYLFESAKKTFQDLEGMKNGSGMGSPVFQSFTRSFINKIYFQRRKIFAFSKVKKKFHSIKSFQINGKLSEQFS